jgi:hypothetical protein
MRKKCWPGLSSSAKGLIQWERNHAPCNATQVSPPLPFEAIAAEGCLMANFNYPQHLQGCAPWRRQAS